MPREPAELDAEQPRPPETSARDLTGHRRVAAVLEVLALHHLHPELRQLPGAVRTARAAADALGVTPAEIANSLVFVATGHDGATSPCSSSPPVGTGSTRPRWPACSAGHDRAGRPRLRP